MKLVFKICLLLLFCSSAFEVSAKSIKETKRQIEAEISNHTYLIDYRGPGGIGYNGYGQYLLIGVYLGPNKRSLVLGALKNSRPTKHIPKLGKIKSHFWKVKWFAGNKYGVCYNNGGCIEISQFRKMKIGAGDIFKLKNRNVAKSVALIVR